MNKKNNNKNYKNTTTEPTTKTTNNTYMYVYLMENNIPIVAIFVKLIVK